MEPVLSPAAMGDADRRTIAAGTPVAVLMERAGRSVAWEVRRLARGCYGRRVVVVCGPGHNGGDGLVAARALRAWGARIDVVELAVGLDRERLARVLRRADVVVDAMYGTGFHGSLDGDAAIVAAELGRAGVPVVAVDIPSGVDGATGDVVGVAVRADATVTFAAWKPGVIAEPGRSYGGAVRVVDIGIDLGPDGADPPPLGLVTVGDVARWLPPPSPEAHKWRSGVLVVGGSGGMTGAPRLAARAALRAGAGIVWCALPSGEAARAAAGGEVITLALPATPDGALAAGAAADVARAARRFRAVAIGPGLGREPGVVEVVRALVAEVTAPLVVDADALHALVGCVEELRARADLGRVTVLTPHAGEYAALAGRPVGTDRIAAARTLAVDTGAVVLLKGPATVVAEPGGRAALNPTGGPELATAGTGDVLTGIVAAFLGRGLDGFRAAAAAAWVHGEAADRLAAVVGPGLLAGDLPEALPPTLRAVTAERETR